MNQSIPATLLDILRGIAREHTKTDAELLAEEYLDSGLLDSFQFVELISAVEERFSIKFSAPELTSVEFRTLGGVAHIIETHLSTQGA